MGTGLYAMLPEAMAGEALVDQENGMGGKMADGRVGTVGSVAYLDDAAFDDYAKSLGLDPADFRDPEEDDEDEEYEDEDEVTEEDRLPEAQETQDEAGSAAASDNVQAQASSADADSDTQQK